MIRLPLPIARRTPSSGERGEVCRVEFRPGDMPVLAVFAVKVAPHRAKRVGCCTGQVVEERLLLDGVNCLRADLAVRPGIQRPTLIDPDAADPLFSLMDHAPVVTERAGYRIILRFPVLAGLVHRYFLIGRSLGFVHEDMDWYPPIPVTPPDPMLFSAPGKSMIMPRGQKRQEPV